MKTPVLIGRTHYSSSGTVNWVLFVPWYFLALILSAALAAFMHLLFRWGHYYILIVPMVCALAVAGLGLLAVGRGHCRSPLMGAVGGGLAGLILYLGYYYVGMVDDLGRDSAGRPQLLPEYIRFRKQIEVTRDTHAPSPDEDRPRRRSSGNTVMNWLVFGGEFVFVLALTGGVMYRRSRKAYCEGCKCWMTRAATHFEMNQGPALVEALQNNSAQSLAALFATQEYASVPNLTVALDYCPSLKETSLRDCPVYLSAKAITANPQGAALDAFDSAKGVLLARNVQLNPDELPALLPRFPMFQALTGHTAATALQQLGVKPAPPREKSGAMADIQPVPAEYAGRVLTRRTALVGTALAFAGLLGIFAGLGLAVWGGTMAFPEKKSRQEPSSEERMIGTTLLALGGLVFLGTAAALLVDPSWLSNRYLRGVVRREFPRRGQHVVDPNDPEAIFVGVVPKLNWGKLKLESASDVGFLRMDKERREILFEGDKEYWRIPASAVTSCEVEVFVEGQGSHAATKIYYTVLRAQHPDGFWEAPLRKRGGTGIFAAGKRRRWTENLRREILEMRGNPA
jgi:hypothetical protein